MHIFQKIFSEDRGGDQGRCRWRVAHTRAVVTAQARVISTHLGRQDGHEIV